MESTVVQMDKTGQNSPEKAKTPLVHRFSRWMDGNGKLWIVVLTFGFDNSGRYGANIELLDVDAEKTIDVPRSEFESWLASGALKRIDTPILL